MAASDSKAIPIKNTAYRVTFDVRDADGDLVTGATGLDSEVSIDGGTFADCASEATEIATASGMYFLDLTAGEMNGDTIAIIVKTTTVGAKTTTLVLYTAARSINDLTFPTTTGRSIDVTAAGEVGVDLDNAAGTLDAAQFGADAFTAAKFAADVTTEFQAGLATSAALTTAQTDLDDIQTRLPAALVSGRIDASVGAMAANTMTAAAAAADLTTELQTGLATASALASVAAFVDTEVASILADTDDIQTRLPAALVGGRMDSSTGAMAAGVVTAAAVATDAIDADALATDAVTEIADGVLDRAVAEPAGIFAWPASLRTILQWIGVLSRNKAVQSATTTTFRNDADSGTIATRTVSDDGTSFVSGEAT